MVKKKQNISNKDKQNVKPTLLPWQPKERTEGPKKKGDIRIWKHKKLNKTNKN